MLALYVFPAADLADPLISLGVGTETAKKDLPSQKRWGAPVATTYRPPTLMAGEIWSAVVGTGKLRPDTDNLTLHRRTDLW